MIKKMSLAAFAAISVLAGCSKIAPTLENEACFSEDELVPLKVQICEEGMSTKVTGVTPKDSKINDIQLFVFNKHGLLETSATAVASGTESLSEITCTCTIGLKHIVVLANAQTQVNVTTLEDLASRTADLQDMNVSDCVMVGETDVDLTATSGASVTVTRLAAQICLKSVQLNFTSAYLADLDFVIKSIYLINVAGDRAYIGSAAPTFWYNNGALDTSSSPSFLYDTVDPADGAIESGGNKYNSDHIFYCYPNSTSTPTRLVIEAELDGDTYYYPIEIEDIAPNNKYSYEVTIQNLGKDSPNISLSSHDMKCLVSATPWVETSFKPNL